MSKLGRLDSGRKRADHRVPIIVASVAVLLVIVTGLVAVTAYYVVSDGTRKSIKSENTEYVTTSVPTTTVSSSTTSTLTTTSLLASTSSLPTTTSVKPKTTTSIDKIMPNSPPGGWDFHDPSHHRSM